MTTNTQTLFDQLGGAAAVDAAVDIFYRKVLGDDRISHYFEAVDMSRQREKQKAFLSFAFGGPSPYAGASIREAHARMKLTEADFNAVMEHLGATLAELKVPPALIQEAAGIALSVKKDVLNC